MEIQNNIDIAYIYDCLYNAPSEMTRTLLRHNLVMLEEEKERIRLELLRRRRTTSRGCQRVRRMDINRFRAAAVQKAFEGGPPMTDKKALRIYQAFRLYNK